MVPVTPSQTLLRTSVLFPFHHAGCGYTHSNPQWLRALSWASNMKGKLVSLKNHSPQLSKVLVAGNNVVWYWCSLSWWMVTSVLSELLSDSSPGVLTAVPLTAWTMPLPYLAVYKPPWYLYLFFLMRLLRFWKRNVLDKVSFKITPGMNLFFFSNCIFIYLFI